MSLIDQPLKLTERIFRARGADLLSYLRRRVGNDADARDIAQEAFLRFLRLENHDRLRSPEAYLFRIAANLLWERRLRKEEELKKQALRDVPTDEPTPLDFVVADEEAASIGAALKKLPPLPRAIVILHLREGMSFSQIAEHTGIKTSLAKKHYYRAVIHCREELAR